MKEILKNCGFIPLGRRAIFCILMASAILAHADEFFNFVEFKATANFSIPSEAIQKNESVSGNSGLRLSFRDADFRGYTTLPKTEFNEIQKKDGFSERVNLLDEPRIGAGFFLFKKNFPTVIKIGHNSYSKSVSKLKNPSPSATLNPLSKTFSFQTGTGCALPTLSSSSQPFSCSISTKINVNKLSSQCTTEGFFNERQEGIAFFSAKHKFSKTVFIQGGFSGGRFYIENNSTILKKNNATFNADFFYCGAGDFCFHSPILKLNFYSGIQESPYNVNPIWFRIDGRTSFHALLLNFSYFEIPTTNDSPKAAPLIGGSNAICRTIEQASMNPQILFLFDDKNASSLRFGVSAMENQKVTATNKPAVLNVGKFQAAANYKNNFFDLRLDWTHANVLINGEPPTKSARPEEYMSYAISGSFSGNVSKISFSGSYTDYPPASENAAKKEVYAASVKIAVPKANLTAQTGIDVTMKDCSRCAGEFNAGISYSVRKKFFRSSVKLAVLVPF